MCRKPAKCFLWTASLTGIKLSNVSLNLRMANLLYHLSIQIFWGNKSFTGWLFLPYMQNYLWDHGSVWDTGLKQEVSDYIQCRWGGRKELTSMCSQVKSQVFTGYCTTFVCVLGLKPNKHFDCSGVIYFQEENLTSILTIKGSKDSFRISHFKFGLFFFFLFNYLYTCRLCSTRQLWMVRERGKVLLQQLEPLKKQRWTSL